MVRTQKLVIPVGEAQTFFRNYVGIAVLCNPFVQRRIAHAQIISRLARWSVP